MGERLTSLLAGLLTFLAMGASESPGEEQPLMRDFIGLNGHTVQFRPELYRPVCGLARDYHPVEWDLGHTTGQLPPFPRARNGVDWQQVYGPWRASGWRIDVCLMFESIPRTNWANLEADSKAYGAAFAREFGPSSQRKLVESVEIGNEPGRWSDAEYTRVFNSMAEGLRAGDPLLKIASCNLTAGKSGNYEKSADVLAASAAWVDVLTIHSYPQLEGWPTWRRSFPEDPRLPHYLQDISALCRWRDTHASGKPIWITEFGYDSSTRLASGKGDFAKWTGVTDTQQAQWLVRSLLLFSTMPVQRAYVYYFNDDDQPSVHASSGITRHFQPKSSFYALAHLQRELGDYRFLGMVTNVPGGLRVQKYVNGNNPGKSVWVAWSQTGEGKRFIATFGKAPGQLLKVERTPLTEAGEAGPIAAKLLPNGAIEAEINESPLYLTFEEH